MLVGRETIALDGWGSRSHTWGERDWWSVPYRWSTGRLDDGTTWSAPDPPLSGVAVAEAPVRLVARDGRVARLSRTLTRYPTGAGWSYTRS